MAYSVPNDYINFEEPVNRGDRHVACVLLVDTSGSMDGSRMAEVNQGLIEFGQALQADSMASGAADVSIITFNNTVQTIVPFSPAQYYQAPCLEAGGLTAMNQAILAGLDALEERKQQYRDLAVSYYRPWMFLLTDGLPTDKDYEQAAKNRLQSALQAHKVNFFPMAIGDANVDVLRSYTANGAGGVLRATSNHFREAFCWVSSSLSVVSNSQDALAGGQTQVGAPDVKDFGMVWL